MLNTYLSLDLQQMLSIDNTTLLLYISIAILPFLIKCTRVTATTSIITIIKIGTNTPTDTDVINMLLLLIVAEVKVVVLAPT